MSNVEKLPKSVKKTKTSKFGFGMFSKKKQSNYEEFENEWEGTEEEPVKINAAVDQKHIGIVVEVGADYARFISAENLFSPRSHLFFNRETLVNGDKLGNVASDLSEIFSVGSKIKYDEPKVDGGPATSTEHHITHVDSLVELLDEGSTSVNMLQVTVLKKENPGDPLSAAIAARDACSVFVHPHTFLLNSVVEAYRNGRRSVTLTCRERDTIQDSLQLGRTLECRYMDFPGLFHANATEYARSGTNVVLSSSPYGEMLLRPTDYDSRLKCGEYIVYPMDDEKNEIAQQLYGLGSQWCYVACLNVPGERNPYCAFDIFAVEEYANYLDREEAKKKAWEREELRNKEKVKNPDLNLIQLSNETKPEEERKNVSTFAAHSNFSSTFRASSQWPDSKVNVGQQAAVSPTAEVVVAAQHQPLGFTVDDLLNESPNDIFQPVIVQGRPQPIMRSEEHEEEPLIKL